MSYNKGKIKAHPITKKKTSPWAKDIVVDPLGQWAHPGEITKIPSGDITMAGVPYPVLGIDNYGNQQMMYPEQDYQFPGNMVTEYPMAQLGGEFEEVELTDEEVEEYRKGGFVVDELPKAQKGTEEKNAYEAYKQKVQQIAPDYYGTSFSPNISHTEDAGMDANTFNCIGGACNIAQTAGASIPIIPGNSSFWGQASRGEIPVDVYADANTTDRSMILDYIAAGDFIGWDDPLQRDDEGNIIYETNAYGEPVYYESGQFKGKRKPTGGRNAFYPEHSQLVLSNDPEKRTITVVDSQAPGMWDGNKKAYGPREYTYDEIIKGNPGNSLTYGNIYLGRPTKFNGQDVKFKHPVTDFKHYFPKVSDKTLRNLKTLKFNYDKDKLAKELNPEQLETLSTMSNVLVELKKEFIEKTGMSEKDYDEIAKLMPGLAMQETKIGKTNPTNFQYEKNLFSGDFKDAFRTRYEDVKQMAGSLIGTATSKGPLQIKEALLFKAPETKIALKRMGITKDNYDPNNIVHNTVAAMVFFDNLNKYGVKSFDKHEGNNPNLSLSEKLLYLYNQPQAVREGKARAGIGYPASEYTIDPETGKPTYNTYIQNVLEFNPYKDKTQYAVTRQLGGTSVNSDYHGYNVETKFDEDGNQLESYASTRDSFGSTVPRIGPKNLIHKRKRVPDMAKIQSLAFNSPAIFPDINTVIDDYPELELPEQPTIVGYTQTWDPVARRYIQQPQYRMIPKPSANQYRQFGGENVTYGTPEYKKAYDKGIVARVNPETGVIQGQDLPEFKVEEKDTRIADAVKQAGPEFWNVVKEVPGMPQKQLMEWVTGKQQTPSEAWGREGDYFNNFLLDAALDPMNLVYAGIADDVIKLGRHVKNTTKPFTKSGKRWGQLAQTEKNTHITTRGWDDTSMKQSIYDANPENRNVSPSYEGPRRNEVTAMIANRKFGDYHYPIINKRLENLYHKNKDAIETFEKDYFDRTSFYKDFFDEGTGLGVKMEDIEFIGGPGQDYLDRINIIIEGNNATKNAVRDFRKLENIIGQARKEKGMAFWNELKPYRGKDAFRNINYNRTGGEIQELTDNEVAELKRKGYRIENV